MDIEKDKELCRKYPNLYRDRHASMMTTCMCWGFSCGDGWFDIIDNLSAKIEAIIVTMKEEGVPEDQLPVAVQVKEKFAGLRFYAWNATDEIHELISEAEEQSYKTCEKCGKEGKYREGGWVRTLCDKCNNRRHK